MKRLRAKLTYSNVMVTVLAVIVLGGGTAYAASKTEPKNSVGTKQIKKEAVTPGKLSEKAKSTLTGPAGPQGPKGPKGETGPKGEKGERGLATGGSYAAVVIEGAFSGAHAGFASVNHIGTGEYCLKPEAGVNYYYPIASVEWVGSTGANLMVEPTGRENNYNCSAGEFLVLTYTFAAGGNATRSNGVNFLVSLPQP